MSDVDLAVSLSPKPYESGEWQSMARERVKQGKAEGNPTFFDRLGWPQREIETRLKKGLPVLHLHDISLDGGFVRSLPHERVYTRLTDPPRVPRPKIVDGRRERIWAEDEIERILGELFAPKLEDEQVQAAIARYRVGRKVQFCLLNGLRHSEMNLVAKTSINWNARTVRIRQGKTGNYKVIGPLGPTSLAILREFYDQSKTDLVFSRTGNINPKFYRILREACERAGVPYGRNTPNGLVLHDARHTATTHLLESNVSPKTVQEWMGWSDKAFVLYYSHATKKSREEAGRTLEELAGNKKLA